MDGSDQAADRRRWGGKRAWVSGCGAALVALVVAAGVVIAGGEPAGIAAPYGCGTGGVHGTASTAPASDRPAPDGVADFDGDGHPDLALGSMGSVAYGVGGGSIEVAYGGGRAGPGERTTTVDRDTPGVPGEEPQDEDAVFTGLDTGDVNGDGYADVVAGAPRWDVYGEPGPEQVLYLEGGPDGVSGAGARLFDGDELGAAPGGDADFGAAVGLTDLDGDSHADLVVTAPGGDTVDGVALLLPGTADGPSDAGVTRLSEDIRRHRGAGPADGRRGDRPLGPPRCPGLLRKPRGGRRSRTRPDLYGP
ncbi:hypothetical protein SVIOM342S_08625 [Streptomyces violaceorubidus]